MVHSERVMLRRSLVAFDYNYFFLTFQLKLRSLTTKLGGGEETTTGSAEVHPLIEECVITFLE